MFNIGFIPYHGESLLSTCTCTCLIHDYHNASHMESASCVLVLVPVLYNCNVKTLIPIICLCRRNTHQPNTCAVLFSPGETPTNRASARFKPRNHTATQCDCRRASGASQIACLGFGNPPTRRDSLPCYLRLYSSS